MICFQISIFELLETTERAKSKGTECCDLLSNQYIWTTGNNPVNIAIMLKYVVICFQISIFELLETTRRVGQRQRRELWFAFKSVYLNYWKQPFFKRCIWAPVVICFQISIFELLETTVSTNLKQSTLLWFAFKSVYLNYWKQQSIIF